MRTEQSQHEVPLPKPRGIRRACSNELYRTAKRLRLYVSAERMTQAEELYFRRVIGKLVWITMNRSNRKLLADWWDEEVSADIAAVWNVDRSLLSKAFRDAFGG